MSVLTNDQIETINCPLCNSSNYKFYDNIEEWKIVKCRACGFCYTNPRPRIETLPSFYTEEYFKDDRHVKKFYNPDNTIRRSTDNYTNRVLDIETNVKMRGNLLEIGAARGAFLYTMKKRGWKVNGIEISKEGVKLGKEFYDIDIYQGVLEEFKTSDLFDVICMYETLEHVPDPKFVVQRSYELLNKSGIIVIEVPNIQSIENKLSYQLKYERYDLPRHLNHFSPAVLEKLLKDTGFTVIYRDNYPALIWMDFFKSIISRKNKLVNPVKTDLKSSNTDYPIPLMTANKPSLKQNILRGVSEWFPGWRFTVVGKKNN